MPENQLARGVWVSKELVRGRGILKSPITISLIILVGGVIYLLIILLMAKALRPLNTGLRLSPDVDLRTLQVQVTAIGLQVDALRNQVNLVLVPVAILVAVLTGGGVLSALFSFRADVRNEEAHRLSISGTIGAQARTSESHDAFIGASQRTVDLVNSTLSLAKSATERAEEATKRRIREVLASIDRDTRELIETATEGDGLKRIAEEPELRYRLAELAQEVQAVEATVITVAGLELTPHARLIRGLHQYVNNQVDRSIESLQSAADDLERGSIYSILAQYWIGYQKNNKAQYVGALASFRNAQLDRRDDPKQFEISRILCETQFFYLAHQDTEPDRVLRELREPLEALIGSLDQPQFEGVRQRAAVTWGNILFWAAKSKSWESEDLNSETLTAYRSVERNNLWAAFGALQIIHETDENWTSSISESRLQEVIGKIDMSIGRREEFRTKVLYLETKLIALLWLYQIQTGKRGAIESIVMQIKDTVGNLNEFLPKVGSLTCYSQFEKRNRPVNELIKAANALLGSSGINDITLREG